MSAKHGEMPRVSHLFQVQLLDTRLTPDQVERIASAVRNATTKELLKLDFQIDEISPIFPGRSHAASCSCKGCGGGCRS